MDPQDVGRPGGPGQTCSVSWDLDPDKLIRPRSADPIKACGHYAAPIGRTHDRKRPLLFITPKVLADRGPSTHERQKLGLRVGQEMLEHASAIATKTGRAFIDVREEEVRKQFPLRERFWATRLASLSRNSDSVIFICGADHCETLPKTLRQKSLENRVHCADWTLLSEIPCPCCM
jgi:hypothetical protein